MVQGSPAEWVDPQPVRVTNTIYVRDGAGLLWRSMVMGFGFAAGATAFWLVAWFVLRLIYGSAVPRFFWILASFAPVEWRGDETDRR